ncbi:3-oxoacyl-[acyl-carrier protein] reductase [Fibrobacter sp. UWH9]|uniref:SDR family NAD(P)-dependent oxidoreductase n=1 Tax=Fibrobacter sp. UWH9 TaxID=1896213 RepID=UPI0009155B93|nr:SDR family oxidoreductase [Fibrobacter sp. UWH9]SHG32541.1 3-oxoacyl-[acyl-carrier protein] reductase [Fibrobacter sp. UWH9]
MERTVAKTAIITGSNRGIGKEFVKSFAKSGYDIYACARKQDESFERFLEETASSCNVNIKPVYFDLNSEDEIKTGVKKIAADKKKIDVLINNAGVAFGGLFTMTSLDKLKEVYQVNVFAQVQMMQLVSRIMMKQKSGCIINMCSVGGIETSPGYLAYGSSKAALIWITKSLSKELGPYNIRVNGIAPGLVDTEMGNYKSEEEMQKVLNRMSIQRMGTPEEIAKAALYIASDDAAYMTGHIMVLDGGRV